MSDLILAMTGGSGARYGVRLLERALCDFDTVHLLVSKHGALVIKAELGLDIDPARPNADVLLGKNVATVHGWGPSDFDSPAASGSRPWSAMAICPCSMGTAGRIAAGVSNDLITRAADVALKERRRLVLVVRETPFSTIHLRNLLTLSEAGAIVLPAAPGFYHRPERVEDLVDFVVERVLAHLRE